MAGRNWAWTAQQVYTFANQASACLPVGFSMITFESITERFDNCDTEKLITLYRTAQPDGGTVLAPAIESALTRRSSTKPLAIVVITDGQPSDRREVESTIMKAASKLSNKDQLRIVFLTIGDDSPDWLQYLDDELVLRGAKHDVVTTLTFSEVCRLVARYRKSGRGSPLNALSFHRPNALNIPWSKSNKQGGRRPALFILGQAHLLSHSQVH
jgi:hypothetical protein